MQAIRSILIVYHKFSYIIPSQKLFIGVFQKQPTAELVYRVSYSVDKLVPTIMSINNKCFAIETAVYVYTYTLLRRAYGGYDSHYCMKSCIPHVL
jgi:hypothetical protein